MFRRKSEIEERLDDLEWQVSVQMDQIANLQEAVITLNGLELDRLCENNKPKKAKKEKK